MQPLGFIHAPAAPGLGRYPDDRARRPDGPSQALVQGGLLDAIGATDVAALPRASYPDDAPRADQTPHVPVAQSFTLALADAVSGAREEGFTPLVCGGDGSVVLGCGLALARTGRHALVFLDAHHAYPHPGGVGPPDVAGADLAMFTGRGTGSLTDLEHHRPCFRGQDVILFGLRATDGGQRRKLDELQNAGLGFVSLEDGRTLGMEWVGRALADSYEKQPELDGFWVHLDADVLDPSVMPAVGSPEPGGLTAEELTTLLARLVRSPRFVGMDVTVPDPDLDADGSSQRTLADIIHRVFATSEKTSLS